jgi:hypothetical protein
VGKSCLELRNFQNPFFNKDNSVLELPFTKKPLKFAPFVELAKLKFTYSHVHISSDEVVSSESWKRLDPN